MAKDSILLRSAESIGRVIGTLQRQLDDVRGQAPSANGASAREEREGRHIVRRNGHNGTSKPKGKTRAKTTVAAKKPVPKPSPRAASGRTAKAKSTAAKKATPRSRSRNSSR